MTQSQVLRDLAWSVSSPSLIDDHDPLTRPFDENAVDLHDLHAFVRKHESRRVGLYFENLIRFWLTRVRRVELVGHNIQVIREKRTIGEIDFLFRDAQGRLTHLETAVKFYLHVMDSAGNQYIGPNAADTFEKKMGRLFEHQLPLSRDSYPEVTRRVAIVKGRIFYHPSGEPPGELPARLATGHLRETWIHQHELSWFDQQDRGFAYLLLAKPHWLSPVVAEPDAPELMHLSELKAAISERMASGPQPVLVSVLHRSNHHMVALNERRRVFVVSQSWPSVARP